MNKRNYIKEFEDLAVKILLVVGVEMFFILLVGLCA